MSVFRDNSAAKGVATIEAVVILNTDRNVSESADYALHIHHVRAFHGKAFMATIVSKASSGTLENGGVYYGENEEVYLRAVTEGREKLASHQQRSDEREK